MPSLIYIADPMCSWCYGFGPELDTLLAGLPGLSLHIVSGGLRAYNKQPADGAFRESLRGHWKQVNERTGLPFNDAAVAREGFVYDTEPACRAVATARMLAPQTTLAVFGAIQRAFYVDGRDVTDGKVLAELASATLTGLGLDIGADTFHTVWSSREAIEATHADFQQTQRWGIDGFPALVLERDGKLDLVTLGYAPVQRMVDTMQELVDREAAAV